MLLFRMETLSNDRLYPFQCFLEVHNLANYTFLVGLQTESQAAESSSV